MSFLGLLKGKMKRNKKNEWRKSQKSAQSFHSSKHGWEIFLFFHSYIANILATILAKTHQSSQSVKYEASRVASCKSKLIKSAYKIPGKVCILILILMINNFIGREI